MFNLTINLDEIDNNLDEAIKKIKKSNIHRCELRLVNGKNIAELTKLECMILKKKLDKFNLKVHVLDSPIFKWSFDPKHDVDYQSVDLFAIKPNLSEKEKKIVIKNVLRNAEILNVKNIRIFSCINCTIKEFVRGEPLRSLVKNNASYNFLIENETSCSVKTMNDMIELAHYLKKFDFQNVKLLFDIANASINNKNFQVGDVYTIKNYIYHMHFKNYKHDYHTLEFVSLDKGILDYQKIILSLNDLFKGNDVSVGIETDIWNPVDRVSTFSNSLAYFNKLNFGKE